ncbi:MAG: hypothetical protein GEU71_11045 [Actinobacteria bacterium]|nr:hypothetical protein [Actinomycetota bacterium]
MKSYSAGWLQRPPLPGFWSIESIFGEQAVTDDTFNASSVIPLDRIGDPLSDLLVGAQTRLQHRVKVVIPSKDRHNKAISTSVLAGVSHQIEQLLMDFAGGLTSQSATGSWVDPVGAIANERITVLEAYSDRVPDGELIEALRHLIIGTLNQDAMAVVIDARMYHFLR